MHRTACRFLSCILLSSLWGSACLAQPPASPPAPAESLPAALRATAEALRDGAMRGTRAYEYVRSLTVEVGPRLAGSPGDRAGVAWGVRTLKDLGFKNVRAEKVTVPHWERGAESGEIVSPSSLMGQLAQPVAVAALGGSVGTPEGGIEAEVIEVPSVEALDRLDPAKARGKIVFINRRMLRTQDGSGYGAAVGGRGRGPSAAAKLGAAALLIRSVGTDNNRTPHTGSLRYQEGVPRIPSAALSNPDADLLAAHLATGKPVTFRLKLGGRYLPDAESANVIGEIPGREKPEEIVLLACHLDSWDLGTGAVDDAAGCGIVMEAARRIGELKTRPRRTIRVVLYANEEFGLSGARAYAEAHAAELPQHVLAGESDFGSGRIWRLSSGWRPKRCPSSTRWRGCWRRSGWSAATTRAVGERT